MKTVNQITLLGSVGKDPEIKNTSGGTLVANFSLATTERYKDSAGNWQDKPEWHNLVAYGKHAELIRDYVLKGAKLFVQGKSTTRSWDDKESGRKVYRHEVVLSDFSMLDGGKKDRPVTNPAPSAKEMGFPPEPEIDESDLPF